MYKLISLNDRCEWMEIISSFEDADVYYYFGYLKTFKENGDGEPFLFYFKNEYGRVANVFLKRDICEEQSFMGFLKPNTFFDITTVYGYSGPMYEGTDISKLSRCYLEEFTNYCEENNIISEFIRFHPLIKNDAFLSGSYNIENSRTTIYMDLSHDEQYIWDDFESSNRNNIRKAQQSGMTIEYGKDMLLIKEFKKLYDQTMDKDNAKIYYYFNKEFFDTTMEELQENSLIFTANIDEKIIAASIIIFSEKFVHVHFLASDSNYCKLRPNNLLIYEIARWGCKQGKKVLHIGGGVNADDDNLFRFKKSFSKTNRLSFYTGKKVYNQAVYNGLVNVRVMNDKDFDSNLIYFPKYRG